MDLLSYNSSFRTQLSSILRNSILTNTISLIILRATNTLIRLVVLFFIARFATPTQLGIVVFAISIVEIAKVVADFGIDTLSIREYAIAKTKIDQDIFATSVAVAKFFCSSITFIVLFSFFIFTQSTIQAQIGIVASLAVFTTLAINYALDYFQANLTTSHILLPVILTNLITLALVSIVIHALPNLLLAVITFPIIELSTAGITLYFWQKEDIRINNQVNFNSVISLFQRSFPIALTSIIIMLYTRLDVFVLSIYLDKAAVGHYGIAFRMTEPFQIAAASFGMSVFGNFSKLFAKVSVHSIKKQAFRYSIFTLFYGLGVATLLGFAAPLGIKLFLPKYINSIPILQILAGALVFRTLNANLSAIIQASGRFKVITGLSIWNLILIFILLFVLIPKLGAIGAALSLLIGEGINALIQLFILSTILKFSDSSS